jgi:upstream activation factor subunit UAF30
MRRTIKVPTKTGALKLTTAKKTAKKILRGSNVKVVRIRRGDVTVKLVKPQASLAVVVGKSPLPRTEVTTKLWGYIKKNGLVDATNQKVIRADATLKPIFGGKSSISTSDLPRIVARRFK